MVRERRPSLDYTGAQRRALEYGSGAQTLADLRMHVVATEDCESRARENSPTAVRAANASCLQCSTARSGTSISPYRPNTLRSVVRTMSNARSLSRGVTRPLNRSLSRGLNTVHDADLVGESAARMLLKQKRRQLDQWEKRALKKTHTSAAEVPNQSEVNTLEEDVHTKPDSASPGCGTSRHSRDVSRFSSPRRRSHDSGMSLLSESPSQLTSRGLHPQYTLDTLRDLMSSLDSNSMVGVTPDRDQLRDQLEWDIGVRETLDVMKNEQIAEQIAMDQRHEQLKSRSFLDTQKKRVSAMQRISDNLSGIGESLGLITGFDRKGENRASVAAERMRERLAGTRSSAIAIDPRERFARSADMRSKSRRALFEGLANTAELSRTRWYVVSPDSFLVRCWVLWTQCVILALCIFEPMRMCNILSQRKLLEGLGLYFDVHLWIDLCAHFVIAYDDDLRDIQVTSLTNIARRYASLWLWIDLLAVLPFEYVFVSESSSNKTLKRELVRMVKLVVVHRLILARSMRPSLPGSAPLNPSLLALWKLLLSIMFAWHWVACFYWAAVVEPPQSSLLEEVDEWSPPLRVLRSQEAIVRYSYALHWAIGVTTQTTSPIPSTLAQLIFGTCITIIGFLMMSLIIGSATTALSDLQAQGSQVSMRLQAIDAYMRYKRLPTPIRRRVVSFYRFQYTSMNVIDETEVLVGLPRALRMQMTLVMHKPIFVQLPLFWLCSPEEILLITQRLRPCVIMPGEMLIKEQRVGVGLFLLMKGAVESLRDTDFIAVMLAVAAFGEDSLQKQPSTVSIRAIRFCETTVLLREDFAIIEELNPLVRQWLNIYIAERDAGLADPTTRAQSAQAKIAAMKAAKDQRLQPTKPHTRASTRMSASLAATKTLCGASSGSILNKGSRRPSSVNLSASQNSSNSSLIGRLKMTTPSRRAHFSTPSDTLTDTPTDTPTDTSTNTSTDSSKRAEDPPEPTILNGLRMYQQHLPSTDSASMKLVAPQPLPQPQSQFTFTPTSTPTAKPQTKIAFKSTLKTTASNDGSKGGSSSTSKFLPDRQIDDDRNELRASVASTTPLREPLREFMRSKRCERRSTANACLAFDGSDTSLQSARSSERVRRNFRTPQTQAI